MPISLSARSAPLQWGCLLLGTLAACFSNGVTAHAAVAWIAPLLLLRFATGTRALPGTLLLSLALGIASFVTMRGVIPAPQAEFVVTCVVSGLLGALPYLLHRLLAPRLRPLAASLVFPAAGVALLHALSAASPFGTWGVDGYVQAGFAPLAQFASVAGVWGVTFFVFWFASAAQQLFEPQKTGAWMASAAFAVCFALTLGYGIVRASNAPPAAAPVRVAALATPAGLPDRFFEGCASRDDHACRDAGARKRFDALFASAEAAVRSGAALVVWPEAGAQYDAALEPEFMARAGAFARRHGVYLVAGAAQVAPEPNAPMANKALVFDPAGRLAFDYHKAIPVPGEPIVAGDGQVHSVTTPFGRLGVVICFDADFPALVRKARRSGVDVLAIPANDWRAITPLHGQMARFRAIENGLAVVRATSNGLSLVADATGNVLAQSDSFAHPGGIASARLQMAARVTAYSRIGDAFAIACAALLAGLVAMTLLRRKREAE